MSDCRLEPRVERLEERISELESDMAVLQALMPTLATKADLGELHSHIDKSVNGLLRDAMQSIPGRHAMIWSTVCGITAVLGVVLTLLKFH